jgi:ribosomal protein S18 acetylase RimI-like enzyme
VTAATELVRLRPASADDQEFLLALYGSTREAEVAQLPWDAEQRDAFVRMQFAAQDTSYRASNPNASFDVIVVDGAPAGRLTVDRRAGMIHVVDISVTTRMRGAGIGTGLLRALQDEARASGRGVSVYVEIHNPAQRLYERLGFVQVSEAGVHRLLEWRP